MQLPIKFTVNKAALAAYKRDMRILMLSEADKRQVLKWATGDIRKKTLSNVKKQQTPDKQAWKPRKKNKQEIDGLKGKALREAKNTNKMLQNRGRYLTALSISSYEAVIGYRVPRSGKIAQIHQYGLVDTLPPTEQQEVEQKNWVKANVGEFYPSAAATPHQAARLKALGFNAPEEDYQHSREKRPPSIYPIIQRKWRERILNGKNRRSISISEIQQRLTQGQAGLLIRLLDPHYEQKAYRKRYDIRNSKPRKDKPLPQRQFLDEDPKRNGEIVDKAIERMIKSKK